MKSQKSNETKPQTGVEASGIYLNYGNTPALKGVDVSAPAGKVTVILGQSGSGKTSLLRCICGFERPWRGEISVSGRPVFGPGLSVAPGRRGLGLVPQEGACFPHLTVRKNIEFGLNRGIFGSLFGGLFSGSDSSSPWPGDGCTDSARVHADGGHNWSRRPRLSRAGRRTRVEELLELTALDGLADRLPSQLSGGQAQRVALARALAPAPSTLLLDEPFSALDTSLREQVRGQVFDIIRASGATAILVTHDQHEALAVADHIVILDSGRVLCAGNARELYEYPPCEASARALGSINLVPGSVRGGAFTCAFGSADLAQSCTDFSASEAYAALRPHQLTIFPADDGVGSGEEVGADRAGGQASGKMNAKGHEIGREASEIKGKIVGREYRGNGYRYRVCVVDTELIVDAETLLDCENVAVVLPEKVHCLPR